MLGSPSRPFGAMAQLVARFHGMEEVRGSNPLSSTRSDVLEPMTSEKVGSGTKGGERAQEAGSLPLRLR